VTDARLRLLADQVHAFEQAQERKRTRPALLASTVPATGFRVLSAFELRRVEPGIVRLQAIVRGRRARQAYRKLGTCVCVCVALRDSSASCT